MLRQMTLWDMTGAISSPVSADGATHCGLPVGPMTGQCGQDHAPVSRFPQQERNRECRTNGTSGQSGSASSASAALSRSLVNKLKQRLTTDGSTLFKLTWKAKDTPSGRSVCLLRASVRRISDNGCGSWPTPRRHSTGNPDRALDRKARLEDSVFLASWPTPTTRGHKDGSEANVPVNALLGRTVWLSGWRTPSASDPVGGTKEIRPGSNAKYKLRDTVHLASAWATPRANDAQKQGENLAQDPRNGLPAQVLEPGTRINRLGRVLTGFIAETNAGGQLNPELSRWLMGYPAEREHCRPTAMQSSRKSRQK